MINNTKPKSNPHLKKKICNRVIINGTPSLHLRHHQCKIDSTL